MKLKGARALITGAGVRLGRAIAHGLAREGAHIAIHYYGSEHGARQTAVEAEAAGVKTVMIRADLSDPVAAESLPMQAAEKLGGLEILVNSAAIMERRPLEEVTPADWDRSINLNLRGAFFVAKGAAGVMADLGGAIVNIADLAALERWVGFPVHAISQAGVVTMTELLAKALAPKIRVNAVAPGAVLLPDETKREEKEHLERTTPLGRIGSPRDVVDAVLYLLEQDYITGHTIVVDGGRRIR